MEKQLGIVEEYERSIWREGEDLGRGREGCGWEVTEREDDNVLEDFC